MTVDSSCGLAKDFWSPGNQPLGYSRQLGTLVMASLWSLHLQIALKLTLRRWPSRRRPLSVLGVGSTRDGGLLTYVSLGPLRSTACG